MQKTRIRPAHASIQQFTEAKQRIQAQTGLRVQSLALVEAGTLPRTSSGKIRRAETRRLFEARALTAPDSVGMGLVVRENVRGAMHHTMRQLRRINPL